VGELVALEIDEDIMWSMDLTNSTVVPKAAANSAGGVGWIEEVMTSGVNWSDSV
jgi:hypothetical protein